MAAAGTSEVALIYGGRGALGNACVSFFRDKGYRVISVDFVANEDAECNVVLTAALAWNDQSRKVMDAVDSFLNADKIRAVICVAGGWAGGNAGGDGLISSADLMWKQSVWTSVVAAQVAAKFLAPDGLFVTCGAAPALGGTPTMIGYGMAKAAVHQLVKSLAAKGSGLSEDATVLAILPSTLDTPNNRKFMPAADTSTWTPLDVVAGLFYTWATQPKEENPKSGSLMALKTEGGSTTTSVAA
mmetsp:Transcript_31869/g.83506  ORF Transcript_31869/g.83506 Transcript_31869/m.83506 type:complete len:243 (+) Transcript_31869:31-759(+)